MIAQLREGIHYVIQGYELAKRPGIRPYMVVPLIVNIVIFSVFGYLMVDQLDSWLSWFEFETDLPGWLDWLEPILAGVGSLLYWVLLIVGILLMLFIMSSVFTMVTHLLVSPFIGLLAEKVEKEIHEINYPPLSIWQIAGRAFRRELTKVGYWGFRAIGLLVLTLILSFIPVVNAISPVLWYLFGAWMLAMQYLDVPADNNGLSFKETLAVMRKHRAATMGFGGAVTLATATPVLNLFIIPIAVAGGVAFWVARMQPAQTGAAQPAPAAVNR
ncbi:MAG: sulfate transporter CysZ [Ketobacteraceae bacterium]|nr:sulfate transporter CysZ [Ketobacteraceae bacterium]